MIRITDTKPIKDFIDAAARFCRLIENRDEMGPVELLQEAYVLLTRLCLTGAFLPTFFRGDLSKPKRLAGEWKSLHDSLSSKLGGYDTYLEIFDPYELKDNAPVNGSIADDFADIYLDLRHGLGEWEKANAQKRRAIMYTWGFDYRHWPWHAIGSLRAIYFLLWDRIDGEDGWKIGLRKDTVPTIPTSSFH